MGNNPLSMIDPDGGIAKYNSFRDSLRIFFTSIFNKDFRLNLKEIKASEEVYLFKGSKDAGGTFGYDGVDLVINYQWNSKSNILGSAKSTALLHETEHAIQFEHGENGFVFNRKSKKMGSGSV